MLKLSSSTPRVTRSPIPERGQVVVMNGEQFEDGRQRIVVGYDVTPEDAQELGRILDARDAEQERLDALLASINAMMARAKDQGARWSETSEPESAS